MRTFVYALVAFPLSWLQAVVDTIFQLWCLAALYRQPWYTPYDGQDPISIPVSEKRWENGVLMIVCSW